MKCFIVASLLGAAGAARPKRQAQAPDAGAFAQQLGGMLQAAQLSLAKAEAHHEKAVAKARDDVKDMFLREAKTFGVALGNFSVELKASEAEMKNALDTARAAANKSDTSSNWASPEVEERARLLARADATARNTRSQTRRHERTLQSAEVRAQRAIEDLGERLSRRVGDLSPEVEEAKNSMQEHEAAIVASAAEGNTSHANVTGEAMLKAAEAKFVAFGQEQEKKLNAALDAGEKELDAGGKEIEDSLKKASDEEIQGVRKGSSGTNFGDKHQKAHKAPLRKAAAAVKK